MAGARNYFRKMTKDAAAKDGKMGRESEIVSKLRDLYPSVNESSLRSYVAWAKKGAIPDCWTLRDDGDGILRTGTFVAPGEEAPRGSPKASVDVTPLLARLSILESKLAGVKPEAIEIKEKKASGKTSVRKVKGVFPSYFALIVKLASIRQNVLMVGPSGSGKTFLASKVAEALELSFAFVSCSAGMSEGNLAGRLLPIEVGGRFVYVPAPFVDAYENGGVFLFDEIDSADANTLTFINAALANGHLSLPQRPDKPVAARHEDFVCLAAANTLGHGASRIYAGRNQLDGATGRSRKSKRDRVQENSVRGGVIPLVREAMMRGSEGTKGNQEENDHEELDQDLGQERPRSPQDQPGGARGPLPQ